MLLLRCFRSGSWWMGWLRGKGRLEENGLIGKGQPGVVISCYVYGFVQLDRFLLDMSHVLAVHQEIV